ncbi:TIR domain-containing protein [Rhizobium ruizarguesonis]|uniref:nSTAND1 domain-containing NTPase n=1 Tax=Rhizobium ruizarguesonis TaxID=2081791 RepID=UPI00102FBA31|nr:TIR domain-containing protein [Rhizobium ruizarguesonis]TAU59259.1 TIR domain-containing protein [Rhizobium ruizarguesonis]TAU59311.1 TIR domain-containing protein [Rhizobium ruizarguesonis]TAU60945.1 TIR domain-containing protein [Rhizobium ruizarguesonis]TAW47969.1 TIR domain-containing protein [Rhizobium ruizarguesonis]TAW80996.1 TIR domain-containing protein [Rhizobium ruizarguesonis]
MSRIFISHSSYNNAEARAIRDWLVANGWNDYFLDLDPERGIVAGQRWERALHEAANRCQAVMFLVSQAWLKSEWCANEMMLAHKLDKPMFGVIIDDKVEIDDLPPRLKSHWQVVDLSHGRDGKIISTLSEDRGAERHVTFSESGLKRLKAGLDKAGLDASFFPWPPRSDPDRSPYPGLRPLEAEDAGIFFGRDGLIVSALDRLRSLREAADPRLFVIVGASGAGKSSFLRAGIIPRLERDDRRFLVLSPIRAAFGAIEGDAGLVKGICAVAAKIGLRMDRRDVRAAVEAGGARLANLVDEICRRARPPESPGMPDVGLPILVVPIDQGEELFASNASTELALFLRRLVELIQPRDEDYKRPAARSPSGTALAIITIRSDAYERLQTSVMFSAVPHTPFPVAPMTQNSFKEVVMGPAEVLNKSTQRKLELKQDFVDALLDDVTKDGGADKMPLLAFVMQRMFLEHGGDDIITLQEYKDESGGISGAIEKAVDDALATLNSNPIADEERDTALALLRRTLIPRLAVVDPATREPQALAAMRSDLPAESLSLIDALVEKRLLISDLEQGSQQTRLQIAHEALLRQWRPMREWLRADGEAIAMLRRADDTAREWDLKGRPEDWLQHSGTLLNLTIDQTKRSELKSLVNPKLALYLGACRARDNARQIEKQAATEREIAGAREIAEKEKIAAESATREAEIQRRANRRARAAAAIVSVLAILAIAFAVTSWYSLKRNLEQNDELLRRESLVLAERAQAEIKAREFGLATAIALEAVPDKKRGISRPEVPAAYAALSESFLGIVPQLQIMKHDGPVSSAAFSPDGMRIVTASADGTAQLWDATTGAPIGEAMKQGGWVDRTSFSPDGTRIVSTANDNTARLWDGATGAPIGTTMKHDGPIYSAAFSPDGTRVVTASWDETARLWDAATGAPIGKPMRQGGWVDYASFSPDGKRIVTTSWDKTARLWDAATGTPIGKAMKHDSEVLSASFSPDGTRIVTASDDKTARLWDAATGAPIGAPLKHDSEVLSASFSPDGRHIVTACRNRAAQLWDATTGARIGEAMQHDGPVNSVAFSPDGTRVVTASDDGKARLWDAASGVPIGEAMKHDSKVYSAAFSHDGTRIVTASYDKTARLWDAATSAQIGEATTLKPETMTPKLEGETYSAEFSRDGTRLVTRFHYAALMWDAATGAPIGNAMKHGDLINSVAFSPDGTRIVTASNDKTARMWDAATGAPIGAPMKHAREVLYTSFSPDGRRIVTTSLDDTAQLWDTATGTPVGEVMRHHDRIFSVAFSPDGTRIVTASFDKTARLWAATTGAPIGEAMQHDGPVNSVAFSPDGTRIVTASDDKAARLWDAATGAQIGDAIKHDAGVTFAAFSPDGTHIVTTCRDSAVRLWDASTGASIGEAMQHNGYGQVYSVAFSPDGTRIVTASDDKAARLWDAATGAPIGEAMKHSGDVYSAAFSPDSTHIVTASADGTARIWRAYRDEQEFVDKVRSKIRHCLIARERAANYLPLQPGIESHPDYCRNAG